MIDFSTSLGQRAHRELNEERIIWLTTVGGDGTPQTRPVWFLWENDSFLIYSQPGAYKLVHITANARVSVHFNSDVLGNKVTVFLGDSRLDPEAPPADQHPAYLEKYKQGIANLQMTPEGFAQSYSTAIRVTPTTLRGF